MFVKCLWTSMLFLCQVSYCFNFNIPLTRKDALKYINLGNTIKRYEPKNTTLSDTDAIIFFTGGSSFISPDIYSNFQNSLNYNNITVYVPSFNYKHSKEFIETLYKKHRSISVMGHSSGATSCINFCRDNHLINKLVLLDPVDVNFNDNKNNVPFIEKILVLKAGKSYRFSNDPPGIPFIPFAQLDYNKLVSQNEIMVKSVTKKNFGHSDILNIYFSNLMHKTRISVGNRFRNTRLLYRYHQWMANVIKKFIGNHDLILAT